MLIRLAVRLALLVIVLATFVAVTDSARAGGGTEVDLDTYRPTNSSPIDATGPVLENGRHYTITVQGTFSYWFANDWANEGACDGSTADDMPVFASPGTTNGMVGQDAAWHFSTPKMFDCSGPFPHKSSPLGISLDGGDTFDALVVDDPGAAPNESHTYHVSVVGEGDTVVFGFEDEKLIDNYGIVKFTVEEATLTWGDNDCSGVVAALDVLPTLLHGFGAASPVQANCPPIGTFLDTASFGTRAWGDIDCSGDFGGPDVLLILRYVADLPPANLQDCPAIGITVTLAPI